MDMNNATVEHIWSVIQLLRYSLKLMQSTQNCFSRKCNFWSCYVCSFIYVLPTLRVFYCEHIST